MQQERTSSYNPAPLPLPKTAFTAASPAVAASAAAAAAASTSINTASDGIVPSAASPDCGTPWASDPPSRILAAACVNDGVVDLQQKKPCKCIVVSLINAVNKRTVFSFFAFACSPVVHRSPSVQMGSRRNMHTRILGNYRRWTFLKRGYTITYNLCVRH